jgi:hypothetical protein
VFPFLSCGVFGCDGRGGNGPRRGRDPPCRQRRIPPDDAPIQVVTPVAHGAPQKRTRSLQLPRLPASPRQVLASRPASPVEAPEPVPAPRPARQLAPPGSSPRPATGHAVRPPAPASTGPCPPRSCSAVPGASPRAPSVARPAAARPTRGDSTVPLQRRRRRPGRGGVPGAAPPTAQSITLLITSRKRDRSGPSRTR